MSPTLRASRPVVSDTSPLQYLFQTGNLKLLHDLFGGILVPAAVAAEINAGLRMGFSLPQIADYDWITVVEVGELTSVSLPPSLGDGEREAIVLASRLPDPLIIVDDKAARYQASLLGIETTGIVGVLIRAKSVGLVRDVRPILMQLQTIGFQLDEETNALARRLANESDDEVAG